MDFVDSDEKYYKSLEQGYEGECQFDIWLESLPKEYIVLNDLLLEHNNTLFQIDSFIISQGTIYMFEIKNYQGDFYLKGERCYTRLGTEVKNPLLQLRRSESLLRQLLQSLGINHKIESYVVFINPHFFLYNTTIDLPIIFYPQLKQFFKNRLSLNISKLTRYDNR